MAYPDMYNITLSMDTLIIVGIRLLPGCPGCPGCPGRPECPECPECPEYPECPECSRDTDGADEINDTMNTVVRDADSYVN